ncbi:single-stranded-DNA-specific exonuclease RecJ [Virgibacillus ihumii]|uniref:single-stranded-DNA-specific exonuclease RecJ n=1 Tax=Virgibacillus ihumii TaxID=2686091 RepID=UPI00157CCD50|nr:single-stranded-DNA-specific exonuclease RecJ [Virgibacillus ihumii]
MLQSMMKWKYTEAIDIPVNWESNEISPLIKELLVQRGITNNIAAQEFLSPELDQLNNPQELANIEQAAERVHEAIDRNERILIYGDYDADGVSSTTLLLKTMEELGADCDYYIPNRFTEGYGPNEEAFREASRNGFHVIITVDTGIASVNEADVAKELGIDLIITDHHEPQEQLPDAFAIIHPKCSPAYAFKELAGVGVAFKFAQQLLGYFPKQFLDLAAIGTIADLVALVEENRVFAYFGLQSLTTTNRAGLNALKRVCNINGNVTEEDVGFSIGPRLNAVGRLQDADLAVQLLMADDPDEAEEIAEMVQSLNKERQKIVSDIVQEAKQMIDPTENHGVIVVAKEGWNQGVLGIVASNLVRKYDRPAIVLSILPETGQAKGSARSIPAFNLFENCMKLRELFAAFGGHSQAAGMTLPTENVQVLRDELNELIFQQLSEEDFTQELEISKTIAVPEINEMLVNEISQLAPFGMSNPKPIFQLDHMPNDARQIGSRKNHLKVQFRQDNISIDGIGFGLGHLHPFISSGTDITVAGELGINEWNGNRKVQLVIKDMKIKDKQLFDHRGRKQANISPFVDHNTSQVAVFNKLPVEHSIVPEGVRCITYDTDVGSLGDEDTVYLYELPEELSTLRDIIVKINPNNVHVCFYLEDSAYLNHFPTREDFKWFYVLAMKRKKLNLKENIEKIMHAKNWTKEQVLFMSEVFFELGFVKIEKGIITINSDPVKRDLTESSVYQKRINRADIEKVLYYSRYEDLRNWFLGCVQDRDISREEVINGL